MKRELKNKIIESNREYDRINSELNKHGMRLVTRYIFKGHAPHSTYMGDINDWEKVIQNESNITTPCKR